jgi:hypothetical protein
LATASKGTSCTTYGLSDPRFVPKDELLGVT